MLFPSLGRSLGSLVLGSVALSLGCEAPAPVARVPGQQSQGIIGGTEAPDEDNVVVVIMRGGGMCTGAIIAPRVVLTAKHCVQLPEAAGPLDPSRLSIGIGAEYSPWGGSSMREIDVVDVVTTPGSFSEGLALETELVGKDVAVITLAQDTGVEPLFVKLVDPSDETGRAATAIGYGGTPQSQFGGVKMKVGTKVEAVAADTIRVNGTICKGDSGGPLINQTNEIIGVVSVGQGTANEACTLGSGYYNRIDIYSDMIKSAVESVCAGGASESCDGFDNDCDGSTDEDCKADGESCSENGDCTSRVCADTANGKVCSSRCDPFGADTCENGTRCVVGDDCEGTCQLADPGAKAFGESCNDDSECGSLFCHDAGDGMKRCLTACFGGQGQCLGGEACLAQDGVCGSCIDADRVSGELGQDEPCEDNGGCRSGLCFDDSGLKYCTTACESDQDCGGDHHCRDQVCVRGVRGGLGESCRHTNDCAKGFFCAKNDQGQFCSKTCTADECGAGFTCEMVSNGKACLPTESVVGGPCTKDDDCLSGECFEEGKVCTRSCTHAADCGPGLDCVRSALGSPGACLGPAASDIAPPDEPPTGDGDGDGDTGGDGDGAGDGDTGGDGDSSGDGDGDGQGNASGDEGDGGSDDGCSVRASRAPSSAWLLLGVLGAGLTVRRRRSRR